VHCPVCGTEYAFFETTCTRCNKDLVAGDAPESGPEYSLVSRLAEESSGQPKTELVSVFKISDLAWSHPPWHSKAKASSTREAAKSPIRWRMMSQSPTNRAIGRDSGGSVVAAKARDLLAEEGPLANAAATSSCGPTVSSDPPTVALEDAVDGTAIGAINESQLQI
jgi:hypothetical protein